MRYPAPRLLDPGDEALPTRCAGGARDALGAVARADPDTSPTDQVIRDSAPADRIADIHWMSGES